MMQREFQLGQKQILPPIYITNPIFCIKNYNHIQAIKAVCIYNWFTEFCPFRTIKVEKFVTAKGGESGAVGY